MSNPRSTVEMKKKVLREEDLRIPKTINATLKGTAGPADGVNVTLTDSVTVVGRGEAATIRIDDHAMSRMHFQIAYRNLEFRIRDLDSANGTILNGSEVDEYALRNGDRISAGDSQLEFTVARKPKPAPAP